MGPSSLSLRFFITISHPTPQPQVATPITTFPLTRAIQKVLFPFGFSILSSLFFLSYNFFCNSLVFFSFGQHGHVNETTTKRSCKPLICIHPIKIRHKSEL